MDTDESSPILPCEMACSRTWKAQAIQSVVHVIRLATPVDKSLA